MLVAESLVALLHTLAVVNHVVQLLLPLCLLAAVSLAAVVVILVNKFLNKFESRLNFNRLFLLTYCQKKLIMLRFYYILEG